MAEAGFFSSLRNTWGNARGAYSGLRSTAPGRAFRVGVQESLGFAYGETAPWIAGKGALPSYGFMGFGRGARRQVMKEFLGSAEGKSLLSPAGKLATREAQAAFKKGVGSKLLMARLGAGANIAMLGISMYEGYQENGIAGAAEAGALTAVSWGAMKMAATALSNPFVLGAAVVAAGGYGAYRAGNAAQSYAQSLRQVSMGSPVIDPYGTIGTTRQRSLAALQNTHINGRLAMGNEGILMHDNAYSFGR